VENFKVEHLQIGLLNPSGTVCYLNSLFTLLHRAQVISLMFDDYGGDDDVFGLFR
jgi:hypothetical protein